MRGFNLLKLTLTFIFAYTVHSDICLFTKDSSGLLNAAHQLYEAGSCYPCLPQCDTCLSINQTTCDSGNCANNYFFQSSSSTCILCPTLCKKCNGTDSSQCQQCIDQYYFDTSSNSCLKCPFGSFSCQGLISFSCLESYYLDIQGQICRACNTYCRYCTSSSNCQQCQSGYFLFSNNICASCQVNCYQCYNQTKCNQCIKGFYLTTANKCLKFNCSQRSCLECAKSSVLCTRCAQSHFLFQQKCYFGASLLCYSGNHGPSYGKCNQCIDGLSQSNLDSPSYCLLSKSQDTLTQFDFQAFPQYFLCILPQYLTSVISKSYSTIFNIKPLYQIDIQIRLIGMLNTSFKVNIHDKDSSGQYLSLNKSIISSAKFYCKTKNLIQNTDSMIIYYLSENFMIKSATRQIILTIQSINNSTNIFLSEILIKKYYCLVKNCQACYSATSCSICATGFYLQQYKCVSKCSIGFYTNNDEKTCRYQCSIGFYLDLDTQTCQRCRPQCKSCSALDICISCSSMHYLFNYSCSKSCISSMTYPNTLTMACERCYNPCRTCIKTAINCSSCLTGYLYLNNCLMECPISYFINFTSSDPVCSSCSLNCLTCSITFDFCTSCKNGSLYQGKCVSACPNGLYQNINMTNQTLTICSICNKNCLTCSGKGQNCTSCSSGYLIAISKQNYLTLKNSHKIIQLLLTQTLYNLNSSLTQLFGICLSACPDSYYTQIQTYKCVKCKANCIICLSLLICTQCDNTTFLQNGACVTICTSLNHYMSQTLNLCKQCLIPCLNCRADFEGINCYSCIQGYSSLTLSNITNVTSTQLTANNTLIIVSCVLKCPQPYYKLQNGQISVCIICPNSCLGCFSSTNCTKCVSGYILTEFQLCKNISKCSDGYYLNSETGSCLKCLDQCKNCVNYSYGCTQCKSTQYLLTNQAVCLNDCPAGYYKSDSFNNIIIKICLTCPANCTSCLSNTSCDNCADKFYRLGDKCLATCPLGYFELQLSTGFCQSCSTNCLQCLSQKVCLKCIQSMILSFNECYYKCSDGHFITYNNKLGSTCNQCPMSCKSCNSLINCSSCNSGYYLQSQLTTGLSTCEETCIIGYFPNQLSQKCQFCKYPCKACRNSLICLSCPENLTLLNQQCVNACPQKYFLSTKISDASQTCVKCPFQCSGCSSQTICQSCVQGYFLYNFTCVETCPDQYFKNEISDKCQKCKIPCKKCSTQSYLCQTCISGYLLTNNICTEICPLGTYPSSLTTINTCDVCPNKCLSCRNETYCTTCDKNYFINSYLKNNSQGCLIFCLSGTYLELETNYCIACSSQCRQCQHDKNTCTDCFNDKYLLVNICVDACPDYYYQNVSINKCEKCGQWCRLCHQSICSTCGFGYLHSGQCYNQCPSKYFPNNQFSICQSCIIGCQKCSNQYSCDFCDQPAGYILSSGICINSSCPQDHYYFVEGNQCVQQCQYYINQFEMKCHQFSCPSFMPLSNDKKQCLITCPSSQFIGFNILTQTNKNPVICKSITNQNEGLLTFAIQIVPQYNSLLIILIFPYDALSEMNAQSLQQKFDFTYRVINQSQLQNQIGPMNSNDSLISKTSNLKIKQNCVKISKNMAFFQGVLQIFNNSAFVSNFIQIRVKRNHPYDDFILHEVPLQNYIDSTITTYLSYGKISNSLIILKAIAWLFMTFTILAIGLQFYLNEKKKLYLFANVIEFQQVLYFLCFVPLNLPAQLDYLFQQFKLVAGRLSLSKMFSQQQKGQGLLSPWQFYKYTGDIHFYKNLVDVFVILVVLIIIMALFQLFSLLQWKSLAIFTTIFKLKRKIFQIWTWIFIPIIGMNALINLFYSAQANMPPIQSSVAYNLFVYIFAILFFLSPVYFFYRQYFNKLRYDSGLNQETKKLGVSIPLYRFCRKILFIFFLTYYYQNPVFSICIYLMATSIIFLMVFWYQPYTNDLRQKISVIEESSMFLLFFELLIFILNPDYASWISVIVVIHAILHMILALYYPLYCLYCKKYKNIDLQHIIQSEITQKLTQNSPQNYQFQNVQKQILSDQRKIKDTQEQQINKNKINLYCVSNQSNQKNMFLFEDKLIFMNPLVYQSGNQADESQQGETITKKFMSNIVQLAKKQTKRVQQFKNYDFDEVQLSEEEQIKAHTNQNSSKLL